MHTLPLFAAHIYYINVRVVDTHTHTYTYIYTHKATHARTHAHTHTHTPILRRSISLALHHARLYLSTRVLVCMHASINVCVSHTCERIKFICMNEFVRMQSTQITKHSQITHKNKHTHTYFYMYNKCHACRQRIMHLHMRPRYEAINPHQNQQPLTDLHT